MLAINSHIHTENRWYNQSKLLHFKLGLRQYIPARSVVAVPSYVNGRDVVDTH